MPACLLLQLDLHNSSRPGRGRAGKAFENAEAYRFYFCVPSHTSCVSCVRFSSALFDWHYCIIIAAGAGLAACQPIKNGSLDALLFEEGFFFVLPNRGHHRAVTTVAVAAAASTGADCRGYPSIHPSGSAGSSPGTKWRRGQHSCAGAIDSSHHDVVATSIIDGSRSVLPSRAASYITEALLDKHCPGCGDALSIVRCTCSSHRVLLCSQPYNKDTDHFVLKVENILRA
jgi:hypothetical protein